jgi:hypothetical protein
MTLAFAPPAAATVTPLKEALVEQPTMPTFSPWRGKTLDVRPAIWSLRNRPEEWAYSERGTDVHGKGYITERHIEHTKSRHHFSLGFGPFGWAGLIARCSCSERNHRKVSFWQRMQFRSAYKHWLHTYHHPRIQAEAHTSQAEVSARFRSHFTT